MSLSAHVVTRIGDLQLDARLSCAPGETVVLLGPNGAGKSTMLRTIAGLHPLASGRIALDGTVVDEPRQEVFVPAERRRVGMVFQDYVLFPHLTVRQNVEFGVPRSGADRVDSSGGDAADGDHWLAIFDLEDLADRRPAHLSGGQAQRVALARALASRPRLLLMDEPLAALDAATRMEVRGRLRHQLSEFDHGTIVVTHDPLDAMILADRIVVLEEGRVTQEGPAATVAAQPRTDYLAALLGVTLVRGHADHGVITCTGGGTLVVSDTHLSGDVVAIVRPQSISLHREPPEGSARNVWETTVIGVEVRGDQVRVELTGPPPLTAAVTPAAVAQLRIVPGERLWASLKATEIGVHPA
jgi:molybdate transport system ATP-binding protein